jgi:hypothetical protein
MVYFDNTGCMHCGAPLGFEPIRHDMVALELQPDRTFRIIGSPDGRTYQSCGNSLLANCNWLVPAPAPAGTLCASCLLTRTRPADVDLPGLIAFAKAEAAKRYLLYQLRELDLPVVSRHQDPDRGLAFDLLTSERDTVVIGHHQGVITFNLAESDDAFRERTRVYLGEAYRTLLGHFRHEIGHYYWDVLVAGTSALEEFRSEFGDERKDYTEAIDRYYDSGPPADWGERFVSAYATMHPWEDWAETFAHYLHIMDTMQTAGEYGLVVDGPHPPGHRPLPQLSSPDLEGVDRQASFEKVIDGWLPLTYALNALNRSMGRSDAYPFVLAPAVVRKLSFIHQLVGAPANDLSST